MEVKLTILILMMKAITAVVKTAISDANVVLLLYCRISYVTTT